MHGLRDVYATNENTSIFLDRPKCYEAIANLKRDLQCFDGDQKGELSITTDFTNPGVAVGHFGCSDLL